MLKKRLVGVVTVKNGWAVQSMGYERYLPLGKVECLVQNLDRWGADEILVQSIDRSKAGLGPDLELLRRLGELGLSTPLIYAGGIRSAADAIQVVQAGADRVVVDHLAHENPSEIRQISLSLGAQAVILSVPASYDQGAAQWFSYRTRAAKPATGLRELVASGDISEILLIDWKNEGREAGFQSKLVEEFPFQDIALIAFGGLTDIPTSQGLLARKNVSAVAVGNFLSYREHTLQKYREALDSQALRKPVYEIKNPILNG